MALKKCFLFFALLICQFALAQNDSIHNLDEVRISDVQLKDFSNSQSVQQLNDSILRNNQPSLSDLLNYNTVIYFKQNGPGMVSSPSFRGTTAQQTAVVWNGININSQLNGQTDFNTIPTQGYDNISVRAGGGSSLYGSSAIGGSIHLNSELRFGKCFSNNLQLGYGSFNTFGADYKLQYGTEKWSIQTGISRTSSDNDFEYIGTDSKNENGQFYNTNISVNLGYKLNTVNFLKLYSQIYDGERHFSLVTPSDTKTKYRDFNTRNLLEWSTFVNRFTSKVKLAFLNEEYNFYENIAAANYFFGKVQTLIARHDLVFDLSETIKLNSIVDFTQNNGSGSDILSETRDIFSVSFLLEHRVTEQFQYDASIRKETTSNYKSPLLFSVGTIYTPTSFYTLKFNFSRNFRMPTFNDLYWLNAGNATLKPESSFQGEIGNEFSYRDFQLTATIYQINITDMIRWLPQNGLFIPENTNEVSISGLEMMLGWRKSFGKHQFDVNSTYAYTKSENQETGKQLTFVPFHKLTAGSGYSFEKFSAFYQHLYTGEVFTQTDNNPKRVVESYHVSNVGIAYDFGSKNSFKLGFRVLNLWNENYESVADRPFPGRNYNLNLNLNF